MCNFFNRIKESLYEIKSVRGLSVCAMLTAMCILLGAFHLPVGASAKLSFGFLATGLLGAWYGPVPAALCCGISDVVSIFLFPAGAFFPGFTLSAVLGGFLYGMVLYRKPIKFLRVLVAFVLVGFFVNILLNTVWVVLLYGKGFWAVFPARVLKNLITIPLNSVIFYFVAKPLTHYFKKNIS